VTVTRLARPADASAIVELLRASILVLCGPAYRNDAEIMNAWLENKTEENMVRWMSDPSNRMIISIEEDSGAVAGVGLSRSPFKSDPAKILLCYVHPKNVRKGYGSSLIANLEEDLKYQGAVDIVTNATLNSANFYLRRGYVAKAVDLNNPISIHMTKSLVN